MQIKKYIRGNKKRGHEVIAELEKLGGKNGIKLAGNDDKSIYFITPSKLIDVARDISLIGQLIITHPDWEEIELPKDKYPRTYEECCEILDIIDNRPQWLGYRSLQLKIFQKLLICRDAYWKMAGEEMGLGKSWKPDWNDYESIKYIIGGFDGEIGYDQNRHLHKIFAFPTEEMRDIFYENFKDLIEQCKELL